MDMEQFDDLTRLLAVSRRSATLGVAGAALAALLTPFGVAEIAAKRRKKRKRKNTRKKCKGGQKKCNGRCIPQTDCCADADCGETVCEDGECVCPPGTTFCPEEDRCLPDDACCGCAANETCCGGVCCATGAPRPQQETCCTVAGEPQCVNLNTDDDHCGTCHAACDAGFVCINRGCAELCEEDADCTPDACFDRVEFNQRVCAFTASLPQFCDSVETCAGGGDAACAGDIKEACLEDICGLAQGCGRIAV